MSTLATPSIAVLGQGARAAAAVRTFAAHATVTAWGGNSAMPWTDRAMLTDTARAAVASASVILLCADDFDTTAMMMTDAESQISSRDVVNLTSGTGAQIRQLAAWVTERGGQYLDGALMGHPEHVGRPDTVLVYSGSSEVFHRQRSTLEKLGSTTFLGSNPDTATHYETAMLDFAWTTLVGYLHSAALLRAADIAATTTAPLLTHWMSTTIAPMITSYAEQIDNRRYPGEEEWLELDAPLMDHLVHTADAHGIDTQLPEFIRSLTHRAMDAGFGMNSFASLIETISSPPTAGGNISPDH